MPQVCFVAAHGGFEGQAVPLGGGAAVANMLLEEWRRTRPFPVRLISPAILGAGSPRAADIAGFSTREYARFCQAFSRAATTEVMRHDPRDTVVLLNDISEAPDFQRLARAGYRLFTIYHVDVVAYIAAIYLRGWIPPSVLTGSWSVLRRLPAWPSVLRLVFENQRRSVLYSQGVIVPSAAMKQTLLDCYPRASPDRIHVVPWGAPPSPGRREDGAMLREEFGVPPEALVLLTLSRISPEKGQDLLLEALALWERQPDYPRLPLWLFVCGEAAFMQGRGHMAKLKVLASRLKRTRVVFPGYVTGARKESFFAMADLYVFPSRHESYGLTLVEALSAGLPALCTRTPGALQVMRAEYGRIVDPNRGALLAALRSLLAAPALLPGMGAAARGQVPPFAGSAARLAGVLSVDQEMRRDLF